VNAAPVAGTSGQAETDLGMEFSPTMRSGHPVVAPLNSYTGSSSPQGLGNDRLLPPWNTNSGNQTMLCTDCHDNDSAAPAVQGPHGSAYPFMLAGANKQWPTVTFQGDYGPLTAPFVLGAGNGVSYVGSEFRAGTPSGLFCRNCHPQMYNPSTATGTNWAHKYAMVGHGGGTCMWCHALVPHGSKVGRLVVTKNAPSRYLGSPQLDPYYSTYWGASAFASFRKGSTPFSGQTWSASCGVDHSAGSQASGQAGTDLGPSGGDAW